MPRSATAWLSYGAALCVGVLAVAITFPHWALIGGLPQGGPYAADLAGPVVAQRYFFAEPWHWPVLHIAALMQPWGINLAFTDGIPIAALIAKLLRPALPNFDQIVTIWLALSWLLQPAAAVFALRGAGEKRVLPALCIAVLASCQPTFLERLHHATLSGHFTLLLLLGCYVRAARGSRAYIWAGCAGAGMLVMVHPYLLFMGLAFPASVCVTLFVRRDRLWRTASACLAVTLAAVVGAAYLLGLTRGGDAGVYGFHTLNAMGLFYPARSGLFPGYPLAAVDGTGGQYEGYAYLGAGLLLVLGLTATRPRLIRRSLRHHAGLAAACAVLTTLALSNHVFLFHTEILRIHTATGLLNVFRASGRFVWVLTYTLLVGGVASALRGRPRLARIILPVAAILALLDARDIWARDRHLLADPAPFLFDADRMRQLLGAHDRLTILPPQACPHSTDMGVMQPLWLAAETHMPTSTAYVARIEHRQSCDVAAALAQPPASGELVLVQPGFLDISMHAADAPLCRQIGAYAACTRNAAAIADLPALHGEVAIPVQQLW